MWVIELFTQQIRSKHWFIYERTIESFNKPMKAKTVIHSADTALLCVAWRYATEAIFFGKAKTDNMQSRL